MAKDRHLKDVDYDLPAGITFNQEGDDCVQLLLSERATGLAETGSLNMQADAAAFEAWALILHVNSGIKTIRLGLQSDVSKTLLKLTDSFPLLKKYGHYNRFLYRVMKFQQQYRWFQIANTDLAEAVSKFEQALGKRIFCNNRPMGKAEPDPSNLESRVEAAFADSEGDNSKAGSNLLRELTLDYNVKAGTIYRQLPVGLFLEEKLKSKSVFTAGHSAIDLWSLSQGTDPEIVIYELKAGNQMAGIITELMFYANYMYDMYIEENNFQPEKPDKKNVRGYNDLYFAKSSLTGVRAFMLTDKLHPQITDEVLAAMSSSDDLSRKICYGRIDYASDIVVKKVP